MRRYRIAPAVPRVFRRRSRRHSYDVDPEDLEPNGFHYMNEETEEFEKAYNESLWIGLLGEDGEIVRKNRLGTGLQDISGIQTGTDGRDQVTALDAQGQKAN